MFVEGIYYISNDIVSTQFIAIIKSIMKLLLEVIGTVLV